SGLVYSAAVVTITPAQLVAEGGSASDNCTLASVTYQDSKTGTCPVVVTRTFTAKDGCGNTTVKTQTIEVNDTIAPTLAAPANKTGPSAIAGCDESAISGLVYSATVVTITPAQLVAEGGSASDNCTLANVTYQDSKT